MKISSSLQWMREINSDEITFQLNVDAVNEQKIPWITLSSSEIERSTYLNALLRELRK